MFSPVSCNGYQCNAASSACRTTCSSDTDCMSTHYCSSNNSCLPKLADGQTCTASNQCVSSNGCVTGYVDADNDGYGTGTATRFCGVLPTSPTRYVGISGDCCDASNLVRPNQTTFFDAPISSTTCPGVGFNYDCSCFFNIVTGTCTPTIQHQYPINGCQSTCSPSPSGCNGTGWTGSYPGCGVTGTRRTCGTGSLICGGGEFILACTNVLNVIGQLDRCK
ncbi:MAG: hypothetical protein MUC96_05480 [Myxococcaceae bacterium]|nr:hypothetical protein [Myxococcaceae bacterium]